MLLLSRKPGQSVQIILDGKITTVTLLGVNGGQVRLGFTAPEEVSIVRTELLERDKLKSTGQIRPHKKKAAKDAYGGKEE